MLHPTGNILHKLFHRINIDQAHTTVNYVTINYQICYGSLMSDDKL